MSSSNPSRPDDPIEAAADWDARLRQPAASDEDRRRFGAWLENDASHGQVFSDLQASLSALREAAQGHPELRAMRDAAREAASAPSRWRRYGAIAAGFIVLVGGTAMLNGLGELHLGQASVTDVANAPSAGQVYKTAVGERSIVTLDDGSRMTLNTASQVSVRLEQDRRNVVVLAGQALFEVARDQARPFIVRAGDQTVTAHGTAFDVRLRPSGMEVTLIEGRVTVAAVTGAASNKIADLIPGQQFVSAGAQASVRTIDVDKETSWRDGRVFFDDQPLTSAVTEMNRYSPIKISADPDLAALRINGMFKAGQQVSFARALEAYLPIQVEIVSDNRIELRPRH